MTIWAEAHDLPHLPNAGKKMAWLPMTEYSWGQHTDPFREEGSITLPTAWGRIRQLHHVDPDDHANDVGSVVHFYQRGVLGSDGRPNPVGSFVIERKPDDLTSQATSQTQFSGRGLTSYFLDRIRLRPFDHPKNPTGMSDWTFQAPENGGLLRDPSFEGQSAPNGGFEDGDLGSWSTDGGGISSIESAIDAHSGTFYGIFNPNGQGSRLRYGGLTNLTIGSEYTVTIRIKDLDGTGENVRVGVNGARSASHTNAYDDDEKIWWAEIANATEGNGSTTGSYALTTLMFIAGETSVEIFVEYNDTGDHNLAVDSLAVSGKTVGLGPWNVRSAPGFLNVAELSTEQAHSGSQSIKLQGEQPAFIDAFGRISYIALRVYQDTRIIPGRIYSAQYWVYHDSDDPEYFMLAIQRLSPRGPLATTINGGQLPAPGSYHMADTTVLVPPNTWTPVTIEGRLADTDEVRLVGAWMGERRPTADIGVLESPTFYIDDFTMWEGLPPVTIGDVWTRMLNDRLDWLVPTFSATLDSSGAAWDAERSFTLSEGDTYGQIAESFQRLWKYVHRIRYDREDNTYYFDIYNPGFVNVDHSTTTTGSLVAGMNILAGELVTRTPDATDYRVVGDGGQWVEGDIPALVSPWGEADWYLKNDGLSTTDDMNDVLTQAKARTLDQMVTFEAEMGSHQQVRPLETINIYDKIRVNMGAKSDIPPGDRIVTSIVTSGKPGKQPSYQVYVNSDAFASTGAAALAEAVRRLLRKTTRFPVQPSGGISTGEGGGVPRLVVAASDASPESQGKADIVIAGDDLSVFQGVASLFQSFGGGELRLSEGTFDPGSTLVEFNNTWITGGGKGVTYIESSANFSFTGNSGLRDLSTQVAPPT